LSLKFNNNSFYNVSSTQQGGVYWYKFLIYLLTIYLFFNI
jgi:hypothetical protein